jgi:predicted amidohydrolase
MRITLAQVLGQLGDVDANLARGAVIRQAGRERSDLVVFPELHLTGYALGRVDEDVSIGADDPRLTELTATLCASMS